MLHVDFSLKINFKTPNRNTLNVSRRGRKPQNVPGTAKAAVHTKENMGLKKTAKHRAIRPVEVIRV